MPCFKVLARGCFRKHRVQQRTIQASQVYTKVDERTPCVDANADVTSKHDVDATRLHRNAYQLSHSLARTIKVKTRISLALREP